MCVNVQTIATHTHTHTHTHTTNKIDCISGVTLYKNDGLMYTMNNRKWELDLPTRFIRVGYKFLVILSCSTLWCKYDENKNNAIMEYDNNAIYYIHNSFIEFFDLGNVPFYEVLNVTFGMDRDGDANEISGWVEFMPPHIYENTKYRLYMGTCATCRDFMINQGEW